MTAQSVINITRRKNTMLVTDSSPTSVTNIIVADTLNFFNLKVVLDLGSSGIEICRSYLSRQDGEIDENYPQGA